MFICYILSVVTAALFLLISVIISSIIKFEGGANPSDPRKRKIWFIILGVINPLVFFLLGRFVLAPNEENNAMEYQEFIDALPLATVIGLASYFIIGFILSKLFKNGKIGNWY